MSRLVLLVIAVSGCSGMKAARHTSTERTPKAQLAGSIGTLHRLQYEDSGPGRLEAQVLMARQCGGGSEVVGDNELSVISDGSAFVGAGVRPSAMKMNFTRELKFRCS